MTAESDFSLGREIAQFVIRFRSGADIPYFADKPFQLLCDLQLFLFRELFKLIKIDDRCGIPR